MTQPHRSAAAAHLDRADRAGDRDGDGPGAAVHQLAVAVLDAGGARRGVGSTAIPPGGVGQLRHRTANIDILISMGTPAALGWSIYALFWGTAGMPGMTHPFELIIARTDRTGNIYLEAAAGVTTFILAVRYFEALVRASPASLRALLEFAAKTSVHRNCV